MKDNIRESIKVNAYKPQDNPTFTPRLLNRLPKRESRYHWILPVAFVVAFAILICYAAYILIGESYSSHSRLLLASIALITYGLIGSVLQPLLRRFSL